MHTLIENPADQIMFEALKAKRMELAKAQNVLPYIIFHDKVLIAMTLEKPQTQDDLSKISGVGESKIKRYGMFFLNAIQECLVS